MAHRLTWREAREIAMEALRETEAQLRTERLTETAEQRQAADDALNAAAYRWLLAQGYTDTLCWFLPALPLPAPGLSFDAVVKLAMREDATPCPPRPSTLPAGR